MQALSRLLHPHSEAQKALNRPIYGVPQVRAHKKTLHPGAGDVVVVSVVVVFVPVVTVAVVPVVSVVFVWVVSVAVVAVALVPVTVLVRVTVLMVVVVGSAVVVLSGVVGSTVVVVVTTSGQPLPKYAHTGHWVSPWLRQRPCRLSQPHSETRHFPLLSKAKHATLDPPPVYRQ